MDVGRSWPANITAAARIAGHLLTGPLLRSYRRSWGATPEEAASSWPGDELLPAPSWSTTHAVTIDAPLQDVWPWLAQIGQGRGGLYSFQRLENLIGCQMTNTDRILPEHQDIAAGAEIRLHPQAALPVARLEPGQDIVLMAAPEPPTPEQRVTGGLWSFHLRPTPDGGTRLVERLSMQSGPTWQEQLFTSPALVEPVSFVMSQEMLRNIKALAEAGTTHRTNERTTMTRKMIGEKTSKQHRRWNDLSPGQQSVVLTLASIQVSLAVTAWTDLAFRPAGQVNGSKAKWAVIIGVNFVGPLLYFTRGRRR
ncbi:hypothetical protein GCM10009767_07550 [Kocuria aegyptia]|uniref:Cardiolipin synthase N-terminal domain-containing protein n=2 Tax=Kocuria aegyptia TaxID=330943 RepID=A0ABP4WET5_9MICC